MHLQPPDEVPVRPDRQRSAHRMVEKWLLRLASHLLVKRPYFVLFMQISSTLVLKRTDPWTILVTYASSSGMVGRTPGPGGI